MKVVLDSNVVISFAILDHSLPRVGNGRSIVLLLAGGDQSSRKRDIAMAKTLLRAWRE